MKPKLERLLEAFARLPPLPSPSQFFAGIEPALLAFALGEGPREHFVTELRRHIETSTARCPDPNLLFAGPGGRLLVHGLPTTRLDQPTFTGESRHAVSVIVGAEARAVRYRHSRPADVSVLDRGNLLVRGAVERASVFRVEASQEVLELEPGDGVVLRAESAQVTHVRWSYWRETLAPMALVSADKHVGRLEDAIELLVRIGAPGDIPFDVLTRHPAHSVRWAALRAAVRVDHPSAPRFMADARSDAHPHLRAAAAQAETVLGWNDGARHD